MKLVEDANTGAKFALKVIKWKKGKEGSELLKTLKNEIIVLQKCHHPNIL